jgi:hypothetical protein
VNNDLTNMEEPVPLEKAPSVEAAYFDSSKLDSDDAKNMARDVIICRNIEQV